MLAAGLDQRRDKCLAIDIGTNGEMVLSANGRMLTCSTAAGPAFEGRRSAAACGRRKGHRGGGDQGAAVKLKVIGDAARGICGSGLIDAVAGLLTSGLVQPSGRFLDPEKDGASLPAELRKRLRRGREGLEFVLAWGKGGADVVLTQGDLRKVQLAKGAIAAGIKILLKDTGLAPGDLDAVLLAGAFGNYIRKESALIIGLLPPVPLERIKAIGNAAGDGSRMALVSKSFRERAAACRIWLNTWNSRPGRTLMRNLSRRLTFPPYKHFPHIPMPGSPFALPHSTSGISTLLHTPCRRILPTPFSGLSQSGWQFSHPASAAERHQKAENGAVHYQLSTL